MDDTLRFGFGENWSRFVDTLGEAQIARAVASIQSLLGLDRLDGKRVLDLGCGSGLFSLAAWRLGAEVVSFDYDPASVACAERLRARHGDASRWTVTRGDALDAAFMDSLGAFDVVYAWGVLHHTGAMWRAVENAAARVAPGGRFALALYNDIGGAVETWRRIKRGYNRVPPALRTPYALGVVLPIEAWAAVTALAELKPGRYLAGLRREDERGMRWWRDWVDWVGGYPYEVASPDAVLDFLSPRGFRLAKLRTTRGWGCNEYLLIRDAG